MSNSPTKPYRVANVEQGTPAWHVWRGKGISATDVAVILGKSPYKTPWRLWAEKTGRAIPEDLSRNPNVRRGNRLEDVIRQVIEQEISDILLPECVENQNVSWARASLDGFSSACEPHELKAPADNNWQDVVDNEEQSVSYQLYWYQCQWQMFCTGAASSWLHFYNPDETGEKKSFRIQRDYDFLDEALPIVEAFWQAVLNDKEVEKDPERDRYTPTDEQLDHWDFNTKTLKVLEREIKEAQSVVDRLKGEKNALLTELAEETSAAGFLLAEHNAVKITQFLQKGNVDYKAAMADHAPNVSQDTLDTYRKPSDVRLKATIPVAGKDERRPVKTVDGAQPFIPTSHYL